MFVVVAIVIFGIFVVLANTLFGSEGLTNDLKGLFQNSTEQASKNLTGLTKGNNGDLYVHHSTNHDISLDFNRKLISNNAHVAAYFGEVGLRTVDDIYTFNKERVISGKDMYLTNLSRVYIQSDLEDYVGATVVDVKFKINNKNVKTKLIIEDVSDINGKDIKRYFALLEDIIIILEPNKVNNFKLTYIMDNNTYYEFNKKVVVID